MPKEKKDSKQEYVSSKLPYIILAIIFVMAVFYTLDYFSHALSEEYAVPSYYFKNKIIYGLLFMFVTYFFVRKSSPIKKSIWISTITAILLQANYFFQGYPLDFVILFLFLHWIMIFLPSLLAFYLLKDKL